MYSDLNAEAGTFTVYNSSTVGFLPRTGLTGSATVAGQPSGWAIVSFFGQEFTEANYKVFDTDYDSYSMVYACEPDSKAFFWILSRTPTMDQDLYDSLVAKAHTLLPNYDWSTAVIDKQGGKCNY